jgi:hypothetical protein
MAHHKLGVDLLAHQLPALKVCWGHHTIDHWLAGLLLVLKILWVKQEMVLQTPSLLVLGTT